jgi:hypothetical protein
MKEFASLLCELRCHTVANCVEYLKILPTWQPIEARRWNELHYDPIAVIPDVVDCFFTTLLHEIDADVIELSYLPENKILYDLNDDGWSELQGMYAVFDGYLHRYAKERYNDPLEMEKRVQPPWVETSPPPPGEEFCKVVIQQVRDEAVRLCDALLKPGSRGAVAERWRSSPNLAAEMIPDVVDITVMLLLKNICEGGLDLTHRIEGGVRIHLVQPGLVEEYCGENGWRAGLATTHFNPDCTLDNVLQ